jgi:hypothetical protein
MESSPSDAEAEAKAQLIAWRRAQLQKLKQESRMSLPIQLRLPAATTISFLAGMGLGLSYGAQNAGLRFRAENAHRLPTDSTGWYLYHKTKNYHMAFGGVKEGLKMGGKIGFWTAGFLGIEEILDQFRGRKDFLSTVVASLSVAGGFSLWSEYLFLFTSMVTRCRDSCRRNILFFHFSDRSM